MMCHPADGRWLGFRVGMSKAEAIETGCRAVLEKQIRPSATYFSVNGGRCVVASRVSDMSGKWAVWSGWNFEPLRSERHCRGPEGEKVALDFDPGTGQLTRISAHCSVTMP